MSIMSMDLMLTILGGTVGLGSSMFTEIIRNIIKKESKEKEDLTLRIALTSEILKKASDDIILIQNELEARINLVERLKKEATEAENIICLSAEQVVSIRSALNKELKNEGRKSFWSGVAVNFIFFILGALLSYIITIFT